MVQRPKLELYKKDDDNYNDDCSRAYRLDATQRRCSHTHTYVCMHRRLGELSSGARLTDGAKIAELSPRRCKPHRGMCRDAIYIYIAAVCTIMREIRALPDCAYAAYMYTDVACICIRHFRWGGNHAGIVRTGCVWVDWILRERKRT